ncbi:MAG: DUF1573 domain-containing protein [Planctomycetes bacterium]|nr:DUF1573 domain-containing protein [Planctomycetota bacterium]
MKLTAARLSPLVLALFACSKAPPAPAAPATSASAAAPMAKAEAAKPEVAAPTAQVAQGAAAPAENPAAIPDVPNARNGGKRYQGGIDKLDSKYGDLAGVKLDDAAAATAAAADEHEHSHDEAAPVAQDGSVFTPAAQAANNKARFTLLGDAPQVKDLGKLRQGDSGSFDFPFVSGGEEPLIVTSIKPSCGCTKAEIALLAEDGSKKPYTKGDPIPVGQKFLLETEISTDGKPAGPFNAQISLYGNDARGAYNVRLTAEIEAVLTITPSPTVFFGRMTTADKREQSVTVTSTRGEPFKLTLAQETVQEPVKLSYTAKEPDAEGRSNEWEIQVALGPNTEIGMRNYPINFKSDLAIAHPKYPSPDGAPQYHGFMVNVQAQVTGMVSAEPSFLTFGMVRPGEPIERALRVESHDEFKLTADMAYSFEGLQGQEFPYKDAFQVTIAPLEDGKAADMRVRLTGLPADLNGSFGGVLRLKVGHPFMDELQLRFSGVCRPGLPIQSTSTPQTPPK